jgi:hypothetical protein
MISKSVTGWVDILIHAILIVLTVTFIFWYLIAPVETKSSSRSINKPLGEIVAKLKANTNDTQKEYLKKFNYDAVVNYYKTDKTKDNHNWWLKVINAFAIVAFVVITLVYIWAARSGCNKTPAWSEIVFINTTLLIMFIIFEVGFFKYTASKYAPVPPSLVQTTFLNSI